jgi:hypothetical protein
VLTTLDPQLLYCGCLRTLTYDMRLLAGLDLRHIGASYPPRTYEGEQKDCSSCYKCWY